MYNVKNFLKAVFCMTKFVDSLKAWGWIIVTVFTIVGVIQSVLTLNPRVTALEERTAKYESKMNLIEYQLSELLKKTDKNNEKIDHIYEILLKNVQK